MDPVPSFVVILVPINIYIIVVRKNQHFLKKKTYLGLKQRLLSFQVGPYPRHSPSLSCKLAIKKDMKYKRKRTFRPNNSNPSIGPIFVVAACVGSRISGKAPPSHISSEGGDREHSGQGKHPSDSRFERGRGVVVALECATGVVYTKKDLKR